MCVCVFPNISLAVPFPLWVGKWDPNNTITTKYNEDRVEAFSKYNHCLEEGPQNSPSGVDWIGIGMLKLKP